ncbi:MAG TPA: aromatic amino acid ammonia-lyase [Solirubrobacteraceae bacterium]|nr:aromatic amino acid ammonia-lyase [Solirubrobacteraceae bacterium]
MFRIDGAALTPDTVAAVARAGERVQLAPKSREQNALARAAIAARLARGEPLYGASTGVGALRDRPIAAPEREQLQWNLLRSHAHSAGPPVAPERVRAAMIVRANQLAGGGAGVAPELLDALIAAINDDLTPVTREVGSLGTGDLAGLADVALALLGEGQVWNGEQIVPAPPPAGPIRLGLRDALGFMSSGAFATGHAALIAVDARALLRRWLTVAALSFEALRADPVVLDERVQAARGAPGQAAVARIMRELLAGARLESAGPDRLVQDPYPFRVLPQVDGVTLSALENLERVLGRELNARPENALIYAGEALPNGNFHLAELASALDGLRAALAQSASLIAARVSALLEPRISGLPPFLAEHPGVESGVMMLEYTAHAAAAEVRSLALPVAGQTVAASLGVETHASLAPIAARHTAGALASLRLLIATELVVTVRALAMTERPPRGRGSRSLFEAAVAALPSGLADHRFGDDVELAAVVLDRFSPS